MDAPPEMCIVDQPGSLAREPIQDASSQRQPWAALITLAAASSLLPNQDGVGSASIGWRCVGPDGSRGGVCSLQMPMPTHTRFFSDVECSSVQQQGRRSFCAGERSVCSLQTHARRAVGLMWWPPSRAGV